MAIERTSGMLTISVDSKKAENMLNGYKRTIPKAADKAAKKIAGMYADMYLLSMYKSGIEPWTGQGFGDLLAQSKNPVRLGQGEYGVVVPSYFVALDSMKPHWVSLKRGRSITQWAKAKLGVNSGKVFVRPHPWIRSANIRAGMKIRAIAEWEISKTIRARGR